MAVVLSRIIKTTPEQILETIPDDLLLTFGPIDSSRKELVNSVYMFYYAYRGADQFRVDIEDHDSNWVWTIKALPIIMFTNDDEEIETNDGQQVEGNQV